jgi:phosphohistidine phosphatase
MELYFLRHGVAADAAPPQMDDASRPLTEEGIAKIKDEALGLRRLGVEIDLLLTSPLRRARETAEIVGRTLELEAQLADALAPGCDLRRLRQLLGEQRAAQRVMIVGHEPDFSWLIGSLTGGSRVLLKKGGLARVDLEEAEQGAATLIWLLPPRVLREIGR